MLRQDQFEKVFGMFGQTKELSREIQKEKPSELHLEGLCWRSVQKRWVELQIEPGGRVRDAESPLSHGPLIYHGITNLSETWNNSRYFTISHGFFGSKNLVRDWLSTSGVDLSYICNKKPVEGTCRADWLGAGWAPVQSLHAVSEHLPLYSLHTV